MVPVVSTLSRLPVPLRIRRRDAGMVYFRFGCLRAHSLQGSSIKWHILRLIGTPFEKVSQAHWFLCQIVQLPGICDSSKLMIQISLQSLTSKSHFTISPSKDPPSECFSNQPQLLKLMRHNTRLTARWLPRSCPFLMRHTMLFLPSHNGIKIPTLVINLEVRYSVLLRIDPHISIHINVCQTHHLLQQRAFAMVHMQIVDLVCQAFSEVVGEVGM